MDNTKKTTNPEEFYAGLKEKLESQHEFPSVYMFKFIVPNDNQRLARVEALFGAEAQVVTRTSKNGKYVSVTGKELMLNADNIVNRYKEAGKIPGIVSL